MFCAKCGKQITGTSTFCAYCGAKVATGSVSAASAPTPMPPPAPVAQPVPQAASQPQSVPVPQAAPQPTPAPQPVPLSASWPQPQPIPIPQPVPVAQPAPQLQPIPVPRPTPYPQATPVPQSAPQYQPSPPPPPQYQPLSAPQYAPAHAGPRHAAPQEEALPESPLRAIILAGALLATMLLSCLAVVFWENMIYVSIMYLAVLACAVYLVQKDGVFYKVAAGIAAFAAPLAYTIGTLVFTVVQSRGTLDLADAFVGRFALPLLTRLIIAAAVVAAGLLATLIVKGDTRKQTTVAALLCGGAYLVFNVIAPVVVFRSPLANVLIFSGIGGIPYAVALGLAVKLVSLLCLLKTRRLQTGVGPKVWFGICAGATTILLLVQLVNAADYGMPVFFMMLLMVSGVAGYVLLLCSRRVGYMLILLAVGIMLFEDFGFNLTGILTGIEMGSGSFPFETYVSGLFASLLSAVNPTITGLVLLRAWKAGPVSAGSAPMFMAGPAAGGPVAPVAPVASVAPAIAPIPSFTPAAASTSSAPAQPSAPALAPAPAPKPKPKPQPVQAAKGPRFKPYTGSGVCDVCNKPLSSCKAYIVPNDVFYRSPKYRNWVKNNSLSALMGVPINDAYFAQMQARDHSQGSAVCEGCVSMFE